MDIKNNIDNVFENTKETAEKITEKTKEFHNKYVSKLVPNCGKYGNVAKFVVEMVPGVSEYNAVREGDWKAFAIAAGVDIAAIGLAVFTAGAGYGLVKGGNATAKVSVKAATKEIAKIGSKKAVKEITEKGAKKVINELVESSIKETTEEIVEKGSKKVLKNITENTTEKITKEGLEKLDKEIAQVVKNKIEGLAREEIVKRELINKYKNTAQIISEAYLRDKQGDIIKDIITNEARRIDFVVSDGKKIIESIEVTSKNVDKTAQLAKELRIVEKMKDLGGTFVKDPNTGNLIKFNIKTIVERRVLE